jgi:hypothetical protein
MPVDPSYIHAPLPPSVAEIRKLRTRRERAERATERQRKQVETAAVAADVKVALRKAIARVNAAKEEEHAID